MEGQVDQEYLDETADKLNFYVEEIDNRLDLYDEDRVDEEEVKAPAEKAVEVYEELDEAIDVVSTQREEKIVDDEEIVGELEEEAEDQGYSSLAQFAAGINPLTASDENPEREVLDNWVGNDIPSTDKACNAMQNYADVGHRASSEYGIELPEPEENIDPEVQQMIELKREGMTSEEVKDELDIF